MVLLRCIGTQKWMDAINIMKKKNLDRISVKEYYYYKDHDIWHDELDHICVYAMFRLEDGYHAVHLEVPPVSDVLEYMDKHRGQWQQMWKFDL